MGPALQRWFVPSLRRRLRIPLVVAAALILVVGIENSNCETESMKAIRPSVLAGTWYPADPVELAATVDAFLAQATALEQIARRRPIALIAPHAGHQWSGNAAGCAYRLIQRPQGQDITRVILIGPSHHQSFRGASILDVSAYATPLGTVPLDNEVVSALRAKPGFQTVPSAHREEHCLEIQLPFLQRALGTGFRIVPILVSHLDPSGWKALAEALAPHVDDATLLVVSSDFTHYGDRFGYLPFRSDVDRRLRELDKGALAAILNLDAPRWAAYHEETDITVCGLHAIGVLLETLGRMDLRRRWGGPPQGRVLEYYRSADLIGDFDGSVSYAAVAFFRSGDLKTGPPYPERLRTVHVAGEQPREDGLSAESGHGDSSAEAAPAAGPPPAPPPLRLTEAEQRFLLGLARETLRRALEGAPPAEPVRFPAGVSEGKLRTPCGAFVTLTREGRLRGCIGSMVGDGPLYAVVQANAASAAFRDPRFPPLARDELAGVEIEISVLTPLQAVGGPEQIEVGRHGVVLEREGRRAVFLPQVAPEQGWDRETMLDHLAMKAGLDRGAWRTKTRFEVFEALVFSEEDLRRTEAPAP
ncbi:MAG: AmmeMemoRadiSam system protein B [Candidatus Eisenbacteria bacterium]